MHAIKSDQKLDARGLACPMPIVKTKKQMKELPAGQVLEVTATDKGSKADLQAWAQGSGHHYLGTVEEGDVMKHYLRKASGEEAAETRFEAIVDIAEVEVRLASHDKPIVLDVREAAEYAFGHIPGSLSMPLGELDGRLGELEKNKEIYVICRTGLRSDLAAQKLAAAGFARVRNVMPGMSGWKGATEGLAN
ncbi:MULTISPECIES: sulfurtransferase TusA family protein [unclassified Paenibacillus]|uniref:sulfurtransferase TusA family protein n=1 Tax=unclassified Paenibacillus TaxID=185978 RepID=UPI000957140A|nr:MULTISPECIES: sulfurtransferase TusA family protein [unclassified Paenibacillus]ASS67943.1 hypothetical protein CIC07_18775 [Paenibacillus sp. RUD330]SIR43302.1 Rhodanese-related sulfurtransferase [Paenibacillus sp. RU4X]SIR53264.1 Rhodanese-related sulfurtransferase [Paenibacillus sp. RU4T]